MVTIDFFVSSNNSGENADSLCSLLQNAIPHSQTNKLMIIKMTYKSKNKRKFSIKFEHKGKRKEEMWKQNIKHNDNISTCKVI